MSAKSYDEVMEYLYDQLPMYQQQGRSAFKKDLTNIKVLCQRLGNPHQDFKAVHIAGTNGKGTVAHSIASILQEAGLKTGLYTSPHLKDYRERIRINGQMIEKKFVVDFVEDHRSLIEEVSPSFFEITVAMAFQYFSEEKVDIAIIETGLGGRLDSTNIINPIVSVITSIGIDHAAILGDTVELIAREKAGIIKPGIPVVLPKHLPSGTKEVFKAVSSSTRSSVNDHAERYHIATKGDFVKVKKNERYRFESLQPDIKGKYYLKNLPTVLETVEELKMQGFEINNSHVKAGIKNLVSNTGLKGRWQVLRHQPLMIADVGHNEDGWKEILHQLASNRYSHLRLVLGMVKEKELGKLFDLLPNKATYYLCEPKIPRAMPVEELEKEVISRRLHHKVCKDVNQCIELAVKDAAEDDLVFVGGSTFVVAEIAGL